MRHNTSAYKYAWGVRSQLITMHGFTHYKRSTYHHICSHPLVHMGCPACSLGSLSLDAWTQRSSLAQGFLFNKYSIKKKHIIKWLFISMQIYGYGQNNMSNWLFFIIHVKLVFQKFVLCLPSVLFLRMFWASGVNDFLWKYQCYIETQTWQRKDNG